MDEEKERPQNYSEAEYGAQQKEIREKLEDEGLDPDEFDEDEQPACADPSAVPTAQAGASAGREELADLL